MIQREFSGKADLQVMAALARACHADHLHVVDLPYRFSSWAFDYPDNIALWVNPVAGYSLPAGFTIRPLAGHIASHIQAYVELHRAVFESRNMTIEWRTCTLSQPEYIADLALVAVAPDGRLAAFCMGWLDRNMEQASGQIEPLGVRADCRHLGLGRAILLEALSRLQFHGASQTYAETDRQRNAALELYESVGFQIIRDVLVYRKDYEGT